ncbi:hypothetical protein MY3296_006499 [Beauveria thailandica]
MSIKALSQCATSRPLLVKGFLVQIHKAANDACETRGSPIGHPIKTLSDLTLVRRNHARAQKQSNKPIANSRSLQACEQACATWATAACTPGAQLPTAYPIARKDGITAMPTNRDSALLRLRTILVVFTLVVIHPRNPSKNPSTSIRRQLPTTADATVGAQTVTMSMRITLDNQPEFFTNLDIISGQVLLNLNRPEQIGGIVVKLEGVSNTILQPQYPFENGRDGRDGYSTSNSAINSESHKILYKVQQVFPDEYHSSTNSPFGSFPLHPGQHQFPFKFKMPINNACSDSHAMASLANQSLSGAGMFGARGIRLMDGTKQLYLKHVTRTLPPSLSGVYNDAEIRYYIKVTVQRPGILKENWRFQLGFKFMPIEPPRSPPRGQESFARRPFSFAFRPLSPQGKPKGSLFGIKKNSFEAEPPANPPPPPQSVELSARLPHPLVLTCNRPVPLRLIAKKLVNNPQQVYLTSIQIDLIGTTVLSAHGQILQKSNRWVIASNPQLEVPLITPTGEVGSEIIVPDEPWSQKPLPNTVAPSFTTCNISRRYEVQILVTLRLGKKSAKIIPESITLPLHFANVEVFSGVKPPRELVEAATNAGFSQGELRPHLPPRQSVSGPSGTAAHQAPPLPLRRPSGAVQPPPAAQPEEYEDAPPSYSEAMAESASMPFDQDNPRPPFSGVTAENAPSQLPPQKN